MDEVGLDRLDELSRSVEQRGAEVEVTHGLTIVEPGEPGIEPGDSRIGVGRGLTWVAAQASWGDAEEQEPGLGQLEPDPVDDSLDAFDDLVLGLLGDVVGPKPSGRRPGA